MKKNLLSMFALATMLLATGCSSDEEIVNSSDEMVEVSFNLKASEGPESRAISDGQKAKELFYGVFDQDGNVIPTQHGKTTMENPTVGTTVTFKLVKGQTYDFVFWAQTPGNAYYNVNPQNLTEISVNYGTEANDENRDAFSGKELDYTVEGRFTKSITLTRPFGQLNVGTTIEDYNLANTLLSGKNVTKSDLVITNLPNKLNLLTSEVSGSATSTLTLASLPTDSESDYEILYVDVDNNEETPDEPYVHLSMNYLLASTTSALHEVDVTLAHESDEMVINTLHVQNVPIQRNYRTNIIGQLLTTEGEFKIVVDEEFKKPDIIYNLSEYTVASTQELVETLEALNAADYTGPENVTIFLANNVEWATGGSHGSTPLLEESSKVMTLTIDGQGQYSFTATGSGVGAIRAANGGTIIFKNMTIADQSESYNESAWELRYLEFAGSLKFNNVEFVNAIMICGGTANNSTAGNAEFEGCTFNSNNDDEYAVWISGKNVAFKNCTFNGARGAKLHECYGSEIESALFDGNTFNITNKPGVVIGDIVIPGSTHSYGSASWTKPAESPITTISIINNTFVDCGDVSSDSPYGVNGIYESDTDVTTFNFVNEGNTVTNGETIVITSAEGLRKFAQDVNNGNPYSDKTIELGADIDLENIEWTPIGYTHENYFGGIFDGKSYTISNLYVDNDELAGLFGMIGKGNGTDGATVKNVKLKNVKILSSHWGGAIGGKMTSSTIEKCEVDNAQIVLSVKNNDNGDKAGGIVGQMGDSYKNMIKNCKVSNSTIQAYRDLGGILGYNTNGTVSANSIENVTLIVDKSVDYKKYTSDSDYDANSIVGEGNSASDNSGIATIKYIDATGLSKDTEGNYLIATVNDMLAFANAVNENGHSFDGKTVVLTADIDLVGLDWEPIGQTGGTTFNGIFDGKNYTIFNLSIDSNDENGENYSSGLFGWIETHTANHGHIKNVKINGAVVKGHHNCGALIGYITENNALVENCHVTGANVTCTYANSDASGDKAGALIGNATVATTVKECTAKNSTVTAGRDAGQLVGAGYIEIVTECSAEAVVVKWTNETESTGANIRNEVIGRLLVPSK